MSAYSVGGSCGTTAVQWTGYCHYKTDEDIEREELEADLYNDVCEDEDDED